MWIGGCSIGSSSPPAVEEVLDFDVLNAELEAEEAEAWRATIEADEARQQREARGSGGTFSEVYRSGVPQQRSSSIVDVLTGAQAAAGATK